MLLFAAPALRAEYVVLRSGQRLAVTSYQLMGDKYRLQVAGGSVEIAAEEVVAIEPEEVFTPAPAKPNVKPPFRELVEAAAARYSVDADLITSVIAVESNFDPKAKSRRDARGLMQLLPETAARLGSERYLRSERKISTRERATCANCCRSTATIWCWRWRPTTRGRSGCSNTAACRLLPKRFPTCDG